MSTPDERIAELERQVQELRDSHMLIVQGLRGTMRGTLNGRLKRLLETALAAATDSDPYMPAVIERLEDSLKIIDSVTKRLDQST